MEMSDGSYVLRTTLQGDVTNIHFPSDEISSWIADTQSQDIQIVLSNNKQNVSVQGNTTGIRTTSNSNTTNDHHHHHHLLTFDIAYFAGGKLVIDESTQTAILITYGSGRPVVSAYKGILIKQ